MFCCSVVHTVVGTREYSEMNRVSSWCVYSVAAARTDEGCEIHLFHISGNVLAVRLYQHTPGSGRAADVGWSAQMERGSLMYGACAHLLLGAMR